MIAQKSLKKALYHATKAVEILAAANLANSRGECMSESSLKINVGDRIHHLKYGETICVRFDVDKKKRTIIVGKNGNYAPTYEWIKLASVDKEEV